MQTSYNVFCAQTGFRLCNTKMSSLYSEDNDTGDLIHAKFLCVLARKITTLSLHKYYLTRTTEKLLRNYPTVPLILQLELHLLPHERRAEIEYGTMVLSEEIRYELIIWLLRYGLNLIKSSCPKIFYKQFSVLDRFKKQHNFINLTAPR